MAIVWLNPCPHRLALLAYYGLFGWDGGSCVCCRWCEYLYSSPGAVLGPGMESILEKSFEEVFLLAHSSLSFLCLFSY